MSLKDIMKQIEKENKKKKIHNEDLFFDPTRKVESVPSGDDIFDMVTGVGGFPKGRLTELFGMEGSCKSSLAYSALAGVQRRGGVGLLFDHENSFSKKYAKDAFGLEVDDETFAVIQPNSLEDGMDAFDKFTGLGESKIEGCESIDLIVFDSIDAMKPESIIDSANGKEDRIGAHARAMGKVIQKARVIAKKYNCPIIFINQMRNSINTSRFEQNIGTSTGFNVMETYNTPGGLAPRFYASLRVKLEYGSQVKDETAINPISGKQEKQRVGNWIKIVNVKNKVATPYRTARTLFNFPTETTKGGFNRGESLLEIMKNRGFATQKATKFEYFGYKIEDWSKVGSKVSSMEAFLKGEGSEARIEDMYQRAMSYITGESSEGSIFDTLSSDEISIIKKEDAKTKKKSLMMNLEDPDDDLPPTEKISI